MTVNSFDKRFEKLLQSSLIHAPYLFLKPKNLATEQRKFFAAQVNGKKYNPSFTYAPEINLKKTGVTLEKLKAEVKKLPKNIRAHYAKKIRELQLTHKLLSALGTSKFSKISEKMIAPPSRSLTCLARLLIILRPRLRGRLITPENLEKAIPKKFTPGWTIKTGNILSAAVTLSSERKIIISNQHRWNVGELRRTIDHERIHAERFENGNKSLSLFSFGFANYEELEEGLATLHESKTSFLRTLRGPAEKVMAVHYARENDFSGTFNKIRRLVRTDERAFELTMRAKRGTNGQGAYTKDVVYLRGFLRTLKYFFLHPNKPFNSLLFGKIGFEELQQLEKIRELYSYFAVSEK